jgi:hypothetical protein
VRGGRRRRHDAPQGRRGGTGRTGRRVGRTEIDERGAAREQPDTGEPAARRRDGHEMPPVQRAAQRGGAGPAPRRCTGLDGAPQLTPVDGAFEVALAAEQFAGVGAGRFAGPDGRHHRPQLGQVGREHAVLVHRVAAPDSGAGPGPVDRLQHVGCRPPAQSEVEAERGQRPGVHRDAGTRVGGGEGAAVAAQVGEAGADPPAGGRPVTPRQRDAGVGVPGEHSDLEDAEPVGTAPGLDGQPGRPVVVARVARGHRGERRRRHRGAGVPQRVELGGERGERDHVGRGGARRVGTGEMGRAAATQQFQAGGALPAGRAEVVERGPGPLGVADGGIPVVVEHRRPGAQQPRLRRPGLVAGDSEPRGRSRGEFGRRGAQPGRQENLDPVHGDLGRRVAEDVELLGRPVEKVQGTRQVAAPGVCPAEAVHRLRRAEPVALLLEQLAGFGVVGDGRVGRTQVDAQGAAVEQHLGDVGAQVQRPQLRQRRLVPGERAGAVARALPDRGSLQRRVDPRSVGPEPSRRVEVPQRLVAVAGEREHPRQAEMRVGGELVVPARLGGGDGGGEVTGGQVHFAEAPPRPPAYRQRAAAGGGVTGRVRPRRDASGGRGHPAGVTRQRRA